MTLFSLGESWLAHAAERIILREQPFIVAITGSVGKSSTKQMIAALLQSGEPGSHTRVSPKNYNTVLGVALSVVGREAPGRSVTAWIGLLWTALVHASGFRRTGTRVLVQEMGADKAGDLAVLVKIAPPNISIITGISPGYHGLAPVHVARYDSLAALIEEKTTLVRAVHVGGAVILNADDLQVLAMRHGARTRVLTYGHGEQADVQITDSHIVCESFPSGKRPVARSVSIRYAHRSDIFVLAGVFGRSVGSALAAAVATAMAMDLPWDALRNIVSHYEPLPGRARILSGIKQTILLDDSYNASPASMLSAVRDVAETDLDQGQRRVVCLGEMRELGDQAETTHQYVGAEVARSGIDLLVTCGTLGRTIAVGARAAGMSEEQIVSFEDAPEAGRYIQHWIRSGDVILVKASEGKGQSKGARMERVVKELLAEPMRAAELLCRQEETWKRYI